MNVNAITKKVQSLFSKGFFHIFGANAINKAVAFITNIAIVWFLTKQEYGIFSYANNIYSMALLATGLGLLTGTLQFCLEDRRQSEKSSILQYSLTRGIFVNCGIALIILVAGLFIPLSIDQAGFYLAMFGPLIILSYVFEFFATVLRINFSNREYAICLSTNTISYFVFACIGARLGGIAGTILARYVAYILSVVIAYIFSRKTKIRLKKSSVLDDATRRELWKYSVPTQFSWALNQLTYLLDVFLVGLFIHNAESVASYKVATMLPEGLLFIPSSVIVFAIPYFIKHNHDRDWFISKAKAFLAVSSIGYAALSLLLFLLAEPIIVLLWGAQYLDATLAFRLLAVSFAFSALRSACTHLLTAIRAVKENFTISIISLVINAILCILLIPQYGVNGAAIAPLAVSILIFIIAAAVLGKNMLRIPKGVQ